MDEEESVRRQMRRAQLAAMHNKRVMDAGALAAGCSVEGDVVLAC